MAARKKTLLSIEEALELIFEDSPSEDSDLVTHEGNPDSNDSDYELPTPERKTIMKWLLDHSHQRLRPSYDANQSSIQSQPHQPHLSYDAGHLHQ
ncbi:hypothetical protein NQZ68_005136 [Dissostichus eleginoides]|nr:hypothetical protein NQZ68_005136 [Dissostichus eleginoides]